MFRAKALHRLPTVLVAYNRRLHAIVCRHQSRTLHEILGGGGGEFRLSYHHLLLLKILVYFKLFCDTINFVPYIA